MIEGFFNSRIVVCSGDAWHYLRDTPADKYDSIVTDPPYALVSITKRFGSENAAPAKGDVYARASAGFMGKQWDTGETAFAVEFWRECLRVLKPGGYVLAFSGTRTYHRLACAIEDAGFEVRDMVSWVYGSGFPKSHDVSKGIDKAAGYQRGTNPDVRNGHKTNNSTKGDKYSLGYSGQVEIDRGPVSCEALQWQGWGTALKPACEPICMARKPLSEKTVAANVLKHGTGAINIDGCRVETADNLNGGAYSSGSKDLGAATSYATGVNAGEFVQPSGRWPANLIYDGSEEVIAAFPETNSGGAPSPGCRNIAQDWGNFAARSLTHHGASNGSAARFFYSAKADTDDRLGSKHPTVKPVDLMQWLVRLVTPPGGTVLDPFAGTGTTGEAAFREGMRCVLMEREKDYQADIRRRMQLVMSGPDERMRESVKARVGELPFEEGTLFFDGKS